MTVSGVPKDLWSLLSGRMWHATSLSSAFSILDDSKISHDYHDTHYPDAFVRSIGGVSLFDFRKYKEVESIKLNPSMWVGWLGRERRAPYAVWFLIDETLCDVQSLIDPDSIFQMWERSGVCARILPSVEGAHFGFVPIEAIGGALVIDAFNPSRFIFIENIMQMQNVLCILMREK